MRLIDDQRSSFERNGLWRTTIFSAIIVTPSLLALTITAGTPSASAFCVLTSSIKQIHVCTNKSCRKAGSRTTLDTFKALAPPNVDVIESGCQGKCGLGPNVLTKPTEEVYTGVSQPTTVAAIIEIDFAHAVPDALLGAFTSVPEGDVLYQRGLHADALACYNKCINTPGAFERNDHALSVAKVKQSSAMRMVANNVREGGAGAATSPATLEDAETAAREAIKLWPANTAAWLHLSDVLVDMGRVDEALENLSALKTHVPEAKSAASEKAVRIRRG
ncbi:unnamed protein product [Ascophyllum nodosum]